MASEGVKNPFDPLQELAKDPVPPFPVTDHEASCSFPSRTALGSRLWRA